MTEESDAKIDKDLADTRRIIAQTTRLLQRIDQAAEQFFTGRDADGNRPKPA